MKFFVKALPAGPVKSQLSGRMAIALAGIVALMLVAQLFTFDEFILLADTFAIPGVTGVTFATLIIVLELLALPFLLRMILSTAFRWLSAASLLLAMGAWLYVSIAAMGSAIESVGFFGGVGILTPGWWAVLVSIVWFIMALWALWGLWPGQKRTHAR